MICVVTDNARNLDKTRDALKEDDSSLVLYNTIIKNSSSYIDIVHEDDFDKQIARKILEISIYFNARDLATHLHPIAFALDEARSDGHSIADLYHMWMSLQQDSLLETRCDIVKKLCKQDLTIKH